MYKARNIQTQYKKTRHNKQNTHKAAGQHGIALTLVSECTFSRAHPQKLLSFAPLSAHTLGLQKGGLCDDLRMILDEFWASLG